MSFKFHCYFGITNKVKFRAILLYGVAGVVILSSDNYLDFYAIVPVTVLKYTKTIWKIR